MEEILQDVIEMAKDNSNLYQCLIDAKDAEIRQLRANYNEARNRINSLEEENIRLGAELEKQDPRPF
ncbi:hypothetical protein [Peptoniphilus asaccharolyticus]